MHALVVVDRNGDEVPAIAGHLALPMLPVAGRPLLTYTMELLAQAIDVGRITVCLERTDKSTKNWLETRHWHDVPVKIVDSMECVADYDVAVRGDILRHKHCRPRRIADLIDVGAGIAETVDDVAWAVVKRAARGRSDVRLLCSPEDIHASIISTAIFGCAGAAPFGWLSDDGVRIGLNSNIRTFRPAGFGVTVGSGSFVGDSVLLGPNTVIGDNCTVGRHANLENVVVLPNSNIGAGTYLRDAIVAGTNLICLRGDSLSSSQRRINRTAA